MRTKMHGGAQKPLFAFAKENRENPTYAEKILWNYLKTKPFNIKFRRQHPYATYILDFFCHSLKIVIEVDGSIHNLPGAKEYDMERQKALENDGLMVVRFTNAEIISSFDKTTEYLNSLIQQRINEKQ